MWKVQPVKIVDGDNLGQIQATSQTDLSPNGSKGRGDTWILRTGTGFQPLGHLNFGVVMCNTPCDASG